MAKLLTMAILQMHTLPDSILRQKAKKITAIDSSIQKLIDDMIDTMRANSGVGLAAPQIGISLRLAVIEIPESGKVITLVNPEIVKRQGERILEEACLSVPGYYGEIKRAEAVTVKARDRNGKNFRLKGRNLLAQALEHETDHLDGILYIDHIDNPEKLYKVSE